MSVDVDCLAIPSLVITGTNNLRRSGERLGGHLVEVGRKCPLQLGRGRRKDQLDAVGEVAIESLSPRLHGVHHLTHKPLGNQVGRQLTSHNHHRPWPLRSSPARLGRGADHHISFFKHHLTAIGKFQHRLPRSVDGRQDWRGIGRGQGLPHHGQTLPQPRAELFQVGQDAPLDIPLRFATDFKLFDVQLVADQLGVGSQPSLIASGRIGQDDLDL